MSLWGCITHRKRTELPDPFVSPTLGTEDTGGARPETIFVFVESPAWKGRQTLANHTDEGQMTRGTCCRQGVVPREADEEAGLAWGWGGDPGRLR